MLGLLRLIRRLIEGSVSAIVLIAAAALWGGSETINTLLAERSAASLVFLGVLTVVLADLIAKMISILGRTFPDLIPKIETDDKKRASLISRMRPGQTMALLSGAYAARVAMFVAIFAALGASYASAPDAVQASLFGDYGALAAGEAFLREGVAGSIGYFLFFLGADTLAPIKAVFQPEPIAVASADGDVLLAGIRLYGLAFVLAVLRTLVTPLTYLRARLRARSLPPDEDAADGFGDRAALLFR